MEQKKIMILYSTAGMGHKKAAIAVEKMFKQMASAADVHVEMIDTLSYATPLCKFLYLDAYVLLMTKARWLWGALYYFSDNTFVDKVTRKLRAYLDNRSLPGLAEYIEKQQPDAVISTHFILPSISKILRDDYKISSKFYTIVTDYGPHSYWLSDKVEVYFVGSDSTKRELLARGVEGGKVVPSGIPVEDKFSGGINAESVKAKYGMDKDLKTIFLMSGGFGVGPIAQMLLTLSRCTAEIQVIVVCGHNQAVYEQLSDMKDQFDYPIILFGFTDRVAELMSASDIMITKAGGISSTEAMDMNLPMILFASIPGQETWNEDMLTEAGAAVKASGIDDIPVIVDKLLLSEDAYKKMLQSISDIRKPNAAKDIVEKVLGDING